MGEEGRGKEGEKRREGVKGKGKEKECISLFHRKWEVGLVGHWYFVFGSEVELWLNST